MTGQDLVDQAAQPRDAAAHGLVLDLEGGDEIVVERCGRSVHRISRLADAQRAGKGREGLRVRRRI